MKNLLYSFLFLIFTSHLPAQQWINCTNGFQIKDGVEQDDILWIATTGGLVKRELNTGETTIYNRGNAPIPSNDVQSVEIDTAGQIWVSTNRGSAFFDGTNWTVFYNKIGLIQLDAEDNIVIAELDSIHTWDGLQFESAPITNGFYAVSDLAINPTNNDKWLSYFTFGVYAIYQYNDQGITIFNHQNSPLPFESPASNPLLIDEQSRLWAGNSYGLYRYAGAEWQDLSSTLPNLPTGDFSALAMDDDGNVWATARNFESHRLIKFFNDDSFEVYEIPPSINAYANIPVLRVLQNQDDLIYVGTSNNGLWLFDLSDWSRINTSLSEYVSNQTDQIFIDGEIAYVIGGLTYYNGPRSMLSISEDDWTLFGPSNLPTDITSDFPKEIVGRYLDTLWVYSGDTLLANVDGNWSLPKVPDLLPGVDELNAFSYREPNGNRWLLEKYQSYLFYQSDQGWLTFPHQEHGAVSGQYESFFTHPQTGIFWLASANGLSYYDGNDWTILNPEDYGMNSHWVYDLELDTSGVIWGITRDAVFKIENNIPVVFATQNEIINYSFLRSLEFDAQGKLWVGLDHAIAHLEGTDWVVMDNTNSGVPNGSINELAFDQMGNMWLGSSNGGFAVFNEDGLPGYFFEDFHTDISEVQLNEQLLSIYPNPISKNNLLTIEIMDPSVIDSTSEIRIYNNLGQLQMKKSITNSYNQIPLQHLEMSGTYFLVFQSSSGFTVKKFVVQ